VIHPLWVAAPAAFRTDAWRAPALAAVAASPSDPADPFDARLRRGLRRQFDAVMGEPIPERLLRLVEGGRAGLGRTG
jgi:Anti-sigma factor NepR